MKKTSFQILVALMIVLFFSTTSAASYNFFGGFIPQGTPEIDGVLEPKEWDAMGHITLYKFFGEDSKIEIRLMWDQNCLYLGAETEDFELWVDDYNASTPWESTWDDDAFQWDIDPDRSRDEFMQPDDRTFAVNANGSAYRFDKGNGSGGTAGATEIVDKILYKVRYNGRLNDYTFGEISSESRKDGGFTVEVAITWQNLFGSENASAPSDGYALGMNFKSIEDDTGGPLAPEYHKEWKRVFDELTAFMGEDRRPENWAEFVLSSKRDSTPPAPISGLRTSRTNAFSTKISFTATGDNGSEGYAEAYDIRYSVSGITKDNWNTAMVYQNNFHPQKSGKQETFKIIGLEPGTSYSLGIKAVDERGNASLLTTASVTTSSASPGDKGFITSDPGGRYFSWENGEPFVVIGDNQGIPWPRIRTFYDGDMWDKMKGRYRNFYEEEGVSEGRDYLRYLSDHGVNTIRLMAESLDLEKPVYLFEDVSNGPDNIRFNDDTLRFLKTLLDECANYNICVVIVPFDTFYYKDKWPEIPFSTTMGGPMSEPSEFFDPANREYLKAILSKLAETVGDRRNLLAWDIVNEFDSDDLIHGWNRAPFDKREETVNDLATYMRSIDPNHLICLSSVRWNPIFTTHQTGENRVMPGDDAALVLNDRNFDFNSTHAYYHDIRDPNYNHPNNRGAYLVADMDNTIAPAVRISQGLQFYYANSLTPKPYFNTEAGPLGRYTPEYDQYFTEEDDYQYFHNMIWAHLASGEVGTGLRWPGAMLGDHALADQMRKYQLALRHFISENLDFSGFQPVQIGSYMEISNTDIPIVKTGITDGKQGIIFLVNDERRQANGTIFGARLMVPKLDAYGEFNVEFWNSYDETKTSPIRTAPVESDASGQVLLDLPAFSKTRVIKFYKTGSNEPDGPFAEYDENGNNQWEKSEAVAAVTDYLVYGKITREEAIAIVTGYLLSKSVDDTELSLTE